MRPFRDRPINQKLAIITLVTTGGALALTAFGNIVADSLLYRRYLSRDLTVLARVIADNSTAALQFDDPTAADQILAALRARSHVLGACIYRTGDGVTGGPFAQYSAGGRFSCPPALGAALAGPNATISQPVGLDNRRIGTLELYYDVGELYERLRFYGTIVVGVFLLSCIAAFLLSRGLRQGLVTPISRLVHATTSVSRTGDYSVRAERLSDDELGVLVDRFNEMLAGIQSRDSDIKTALKEVETERARFQFMAESMPQKIFTATPAGDVDYFNRQWMDYTGLSFDEIRNWGWIEFVHPADREANIREWKRSLDTGEPFAWQQRFRRADGQYRWHLSRAHAMRDATGQITMWIGSNTDIHEQKETEQELRRANGDLLQFAYSASHDLQEPVRTVSIYSDMVARRYHDLLDDDGRQFLSYLKEGGRRLSALINDLLSYTRASMAELSESSTDASQALKSVLETLSEVMSETGATVIAGELPVVNMGAVHLQQIFQNLIGNALKYRSDEPPRIQISARHAGSEWLFSVRDNGIGIERHYQAKIFGLFKRLSNDQKYSGTGIGLAICQRVVERYGGRIWVDSELGQGATFFFTVPDRTDTVRSAAVPGRRD